MAKATFNLQFLGDGLVWLGSDYERTAGATRALLWAGRAEVPDTSPNFVWTVKVVVWAKRSDPVALSSALETLAINLGSEKGDLKIYEDDGETLLRTYGGCRFDAMKREKGPAESRGDFEDDITFVFTTAEDPE